MSLAKWLLRMLDRGRDRLAAELNVQPASRHYGPRKSLAVILHQHREFERFGAKDKGIN